MSTPPVKEASSIAHRCAGHVTPGLFEGGHHLVDEEPKVPRVGERRKDHLEQVETKLDQLMQVIDELRRLARERRRWIVELVRGPALRFSTRRRQIHNSRDGSANAFWIAPNVATVIVEHLQLVAEDVNGTRH